MAKLRQLINRIMEIEFPVLRLEMRIRQRKARPFIVMGIYAGALSVLTVIVLFTEGLMHGRWTSSGGYPSDPATIGRMIFRLMSYLQMAMVCLVAPAYSAGAISGERERQTLDMLAITLLSTPAIIVQKLGAATLEVAMLLVTSVPVLAVVFMLGGVSPIEVAVVYPLMLGMAVLLNAGGVFWSSLFASMRSSALASYVSAITYLALIPILSAWAENLIHGMYLDMVVGIITAYLVVALLAGGTATVIIFGGAARLLRRLVAWRVRAVRMGVFGIVLVAVLELLNLTGCTRVILDWSPSIFDLPGLVNPFTALNMFEVYIYQPVWESLIVTLGVVVTGTYLLQRASMAKLDILRRS